MRDFGKDWAAENDRGRELAQAFIGAMVLDGFTPALGRRVAEAAGRDLMGEEIGFWQEVAEAAVSDRRSRF